MIDRMPRRVEAAIVLRSMLVQGSWNYHTLIGTGFAFTLLPALRWLHGANAEMDEVLARHTSLFNSHPYLVTVAVGAVARLELDGADPALIERFKAALRGPLGSLGDQLFWRALRPFLMVAGIALLLLEVPWWLVLALVFTVYNGVHLGVRFWGLRTGFRYGLEVGRYLREVPLQQIAGRVGRAGAVAAAFGAAVAVGWGTPTIAATADLWQGLALSFAAATGWFLGTRARQNVALIVIFAAAAASLAAAIA